MNNFPIFFFLKEDYDHVSTGNEKSMRTITLEEHFVTPEFMQGPGHGLGERVHSIQGQPQMDPINARLVDQLMDLGEL